MDFMDGAGFGFRSVSVYFFLLPPVNPGAGSFLRGEISASFLFMISACFVL